MRNLILVTLVSFSAYANEACYLQPQPASPLFEENIQQLQAAGQAATTKQVLAKVDISYGSLGIGAGSADISVRVAEGKIVSLRVDADVRIAGISMDKIAREITITDLAAGRPLGFEMEGGKHDTLVITPSAGFSPTGGRATIKAWNGKYNAQGKPIYGSTESVYIGKNQAGTYGIWKVTGGVQPLSSNKVKSMRINIRGNAFSPETLYTHSYRIITNG